MECPPVRPAAGGRSNPGQDRPVGDGEFEPEGKADVEGILEKSLMGCGLSKYKGPLNHRRVGKGGRSWDHISGIAVKAGCGGQTHGAAGEVDGKRFVSRAGDAQVEARIRWGVVFEPAEKI